MQTATAFLQLRIRKVARLHSVQQARNVFHPKFGVELHRQSGKGIDQTAIRGVVISEDNPGAVGHVNDLVAKADAPDRAARNAALA